MTARRDFLTHAAYLALLVGAPRLPAWAAATPPKVIAVRAWPAQEYTRVTLEADAPLEYEPRFLYYPPRLVVDLKGVEVQATLRSLTERIKPNDPYVAGVRVGQFTPEVARIVFDLKQPVKPRLFLLEPVGNYQYRLVLDLFPETPVDPIEQLLVELRRKPKSQGSGETAPPSELPQLTETPSPRPPTGKPRRTPPAAETDQHEPPRTPAAPEADLHASPSRSSSPERPAPRQGPSPPAFPETPYVVVLDPGHGGEDPGAIGPNGTQEKGVVLAVARRLQKLLNRQPKMRAVLTRDDDYFVPLAERVQRARRVQADLFVSIHADAFIRPDVAGSSVYVLNERGASTTAARWLAQKENQSDQIGGVLLAAKSDAVAQTLLDLSITATRLQAQRLAETVLASLGPVSHPHRPQVESANFAVLRNPDVPSILVELAFITNPTEERRLRAPSYQQQLAKALAQGIQRYLEHHAPRPRPRLLAARSSHPSEPY